MQKFFLFLLCLQLSVWCMRMPSFYAAWTGHGTSVFEEVFDSVVDSGLHEVQITLQTPFPDPPLYADLYRQNRITTPDAWERCALFAINSVPPKHDGGRAQSGLQGVEARLYSGGVINARRSLQKAIAREGAAGREK